MTNDSINPPDTSPPQADSTPLPSHAPTPLPSALPTLSPPAVDLLPIPSIAAPSVLQRITTTANTPVFGQPPTRPDSSSPGSLALAVVMAYLGLGLALAWGIQQGQQRQIAQAQSDRARTAADLIVSQEDDLGRFLAQRSTASISLLALSDGPVTSATVAWNKELGDGRLFCDGLEKIAPPRTCQLWFKGLSGYMCISQFDPIPGQDIYRFHLDGQDFDPSEIVLTHGTPAADFDHVEPANILARGARPAQPTN